MRYSTLHTNERRLFDPSNKNDLLELKHFIDTNKWTDKCPFYLEDSWDNIPVMCMQKYAEYMLRNLKKSNSKKQKSPK